ncbi:hypothetical protein EDB19DRAFT_1762785 [Suillus lakei]|nr:hypothetical protein EDB19DRAFT_1762785 [Suillus lakei]
MMILHRLPTWLHPFMLISRGSYSSIPPFNLFCISQKPVFLLFFVSRIAFVHLIGFASLTFQMLSCNPFFSSASFITTATPVCPICISRIMIWFCNELVILCLAFA